MPTAARDRALKSLAFAHTLTEKAIADFPDSKLTYQQSPTDNHALWTIGHLASTYAWFKSVFDGEMHALPKNYMALFGGGSKPSADHKQYPSLAEVKKHYNEAYEAFIAAANKLTDADLAQAPGIDTGGFCTDKLHALDRATWHEGWHCGQLCGIRKALKLPGVF
jgi:hypothetical protein